MKAIIAAAGRGSRLASITRGIPKCLVKVNNKPLIQHQVELLLKLGIDKIFVAVGYEREQIKKILGDAVEYIVNEDYMDTNSSYSLWLSKEMIDSEFIYLNGDLYFEEKILELLFQSSFQTGFCIDYDKFKSEDMFKVVINNDRIISLDKKLFIKEAHGIAPGPVRFSKNSRDIVFKILDDYILMGDRGQWCYTIFEKVAHETKIQPIDISGLTWGEIDTPEDLYNIKRLLNDKS